MRNNLNSSKSQTTEFAAKIKPSQKFNPNVSTSQTKQPKPSLSNQFDLQKMISVKG